MNPARVDSTCNQADGLRAVCAPSEPLRDLCHHAEYRVYLNGQYVESVGNLGGNAQRAADSWQRRNRRKSVEVRPIRCTVSACASSRSRSLPVAVTIALNTCMRLSEVRLLHWNQIDFTVKEIRVGKSKTAAGTGRVIPMTEPLVKCLDAWAAKFPERKSEEYVFPYERYGASGDDFLPCVYDTDPKRPIGS